MGASERKLGLWTAHSPPCPCFCPRGGGPTGDREGIKAREARGEKRAEWLRKQLAAEAAAAANPAAAATAK
eukprot:4141505-Pyramimonas_sp.AAC.1